MNKSKVPVWKKVLLKHPPYTLDYTKLEGKLISNFSIPVTISKKPKISKEYNEDVNSIKIEYQKKPNLFDNVENNEKNLDDKKPILISETIKNKPKNPNERNDFNLKSQKNIEITKELISKINITSKNEAENNVLSKENKTAFNFVISQDDIIRIESNSEWKIPLKYRRSFAEKLFKVYTDLENIKNKKPSENKNSNINDLNQNNIIMDINKKNKIAQFESQVALMSKSPQQYKNTCLHVLVEIRRTKSIQTVFDNLLISNGSNRRNDENKKINGKSDNVKIDRIKNERMGGLTIHPKEVEKFILNEEELIKKDFPCKLNSEFEEGWVITEEGGEKIKKFGMLFLECRMERGEGGYVAREMSIMDRFGRIIDSFCDIDKNLKSVKKEILTNLKKETILIGKDLNEQLKTLKIIHGRIIDVSLLAEKGVLTLPKELYSNLTTLPPFCNKEKSPKEKLELYFSLITDLVEKVAQK